MNARFGAELYFVEDDERVTGHRCEVVIGEQITEERVHIMPVIAKQIDHFRRRDRKINEQMRPVLVGCKLHRQCAFPYAARPLDEHGRRAMLGVLPVLEQLISFAFEHRRSLIARNGGY